MHRRIHSALASLAILALAASACSSSSTGDTVESDAAATVNGEKISNELFLEVSDGAIAAQAGPSAAPSAAPSASTDPEQDIEARRQTLTQLIQGEIITQFAAERDVELDDEAIDEIIAEGGEELETQADAAGLDPETYAEVYVGPQYLLDEIARGVADEVDVTDEQVQERIDQMGQTGEGVTATVSHILVETEEEAIAAKERIDGGESFADVAAEVSTDASGAEGGSLGEDVPLSNFVPEFASAAATAEIGVPTEPVQSQFGWHVILVEDRTEPDMEGIEEDLRAQIALDSEEGQAALQPIIEEYNTAFTDAEVDVAPRYGAWDPEARAVVAEDAVGDSSAPPAPAGSEAPAGTEVPATEAPATEAPAATPVPTPTS
ncbi:peptidylprolyl isomerase [Salsipaludibacter albus]|uniref:peptidylprolyl isomerase n=1 Tax=Salsipaludibacter albus TaxID=2849650 RepID=UPI001EE492AC|nr:peptidylprolyl isomerase [Salsipaludibacter albus]